jgi:hypothetical protein
VLQIHLVLDNKRGCLKLAKSLVFSCLKEHVEVLVDQGKGLC